MNEIELHDDRHVYLAAAAGGNPPVAGRVLTLQARELALTVFVPSHTSWGAEVVSVALGGVTYPVVPEVQDVVPNQNMHLPIRHPEMVAILGAVHQATERLFLRVLSDGGCSCDDVIDLNRVSHSGDVEWLDQTQFYQLDSWFPEFPLNPCLHPERLPHGRYDDSR
jgi:hypothetical protein